MKKIFTVYLVKLLPLAFAVMFLGCVEMITIPLQIIGGVLEAGVEVAETAAKEAKKLREFNQQRKENPLNTPVENRLTRRTSTLTDGVPVDISPYLMHNLSFAVTEKGIQRSGAVIKATGARSYDLWMIYEIDAVLTFTADKKDYQMNVTATVDGNTYANKKEEIKQVMKEFAAKRLELDLKKIQNYKVQLLEPRKGERISFSFSNVFVQETEPCYFQFDTEFEFQKQEVKRRKRGPEYFVIFDKLYRSNLLTEAGAILEAQGAIWNEARKSGFTETPVPIINVVKAVKIVETAEVRDKRLAEEKAEEVKKLQKEWERSLARRTSKLSGGTPVDISPYLLNVYSFVVTENGIKRSEPEFKVSRTQENITCFEFDVAVTFEANNKKNKMNVTVALCGSSQSKVQDRVKSYMQQYAAERFGIEPKDMKNFKIQYLKTRKEKLMELSAYLNFDNMFVKETEQCNYQFDVDFGYHNNAIYNERLNPEYFSTLTKVYRSSFTFEAVAALHVQSEILKDAYSKTKNMGMPLPIINFVKVVKVKK